MLGQSRIVIFCKERHNGSGTVAIKIALFAPVVALILFTVAEFVSIMFARHVMFYSAREAARAYVSGAAASTAVTLDVAEDRLVEGGVKGHFTVTAETFNLGTDDAEIMVSISTPMKNAALTDVFADNVLGDRTLTVRTYMYLDETSANNTDCGRKTGPCGNKKKTTITRKIGP